MVVPHLDVMNYKYIIDSEMFVTYFSKDVRLGAPGHWLPDTCNSSIM